MTKTYTITLSGDSAEYVDTELLKHVLTTTAAFREKVFEEDFIIELLK